MNGEVVDNVQMLWFSGEPSSTSNHLGNDEDCGEIEMFIPMYGRSNDIICSQSLIGMCEKPM